MNNYKQLFSIYYKQFFCNIVLQCQRGFKLFKQFIRRVRFGNKPEKIVLSNDAQRNQQINFKALHILLDLSFL